MNAIVSMHGADINGYAAKCSWGKEGGTGGSVPPSFAGSSSASSDSNGSAAQVTLTLTFINLYNCKPISYLHTNLLSCVYVGWLQSAIHAAGWLPHGTRLLGLPSALHAALRLPSLWRLRWLPHGRLAPCRPHAATLRLPATAARLPCPSWHSIVLSQVM